ncbi:hypothetical protein CC2G_015301 [Coprinopsis cinerea AmutBmut pab1-1]|nr:hypothetical protein CC2G_015301 [Coprinopsis cinerea AmutBmut pab1-1]
MPFTFHAFCLHHLNGNLATNLRPAVGAKWSDFSSDFWKVYRSPSPECFEEGWSALQSKYPSAKGYLADLYQCRERWAWAWIGTVFTGGIRTNGRVEVENRITKTITGPKSTFFQVFLALNDRSSAQNVNEMTEIRKSSRRQHDQPIELVFSGPLRLLRQYAGPFALHSTFKEMKKSVFYNVEIIQLPPGMKSWTDSAFLLTDTPAFSWSSNEELKMINSFENDEAYVSMRWILRLLHRRQLHPSHILKVSHMATRSYHYLAILPDNRYMCDCCMGVNLGVPCRHYLKAWTVVHGLGFHMGLVRARWFKNANLDVSALPTLIFDHAAGTREELPESKALPIPSALLSNPLERRTVAQIASPPPPTQTVGARAVNHEAHALLRPILAHVQTQEQLDDVLNDLRNLRRVRLEAESEGQVVDPPVLNPKGRPRTSRITGALEGRARGGGPVTRLRVAQNTTTRNADVPSEQETALGGRRCGICREQGHNRTRCPIALGQT